VAVFCSDARASLGLADPYAPVIGEHSNIRSQAMNTDIGCAFQAQPSGTVVVYLRSLAPLKIVVGYGLYSVSSISLPHAFAEITHTLAERGAYAYQAARAEQNDDDQQNDQQLGDT